MTLDRFIIISAMDKDSQYFQLQPYKKNVSFKYEKLELTNEDNDKDKDDDDIFFNLWDNNFKLEEKIHITDDLKIHYKNENKCLNFQIEI